MTLDKRLIEPKNFANSMTTGINGASIKSIELDLFKDMAHLRRLTLAQVHSNRMTRHK